MRRREGYLSGSVYLRPPQRDTWYMRYRLPSGVDSKRRIGLAWKGRGRPPHGYYTERTARDALEDFLREHRDARPGSDPVFEVAAREFLTWCELNRRLRGTTTARYGQIISHDLLPSLSGVYLSDLTSERVRDLRTTLAARLSASSLNQTRVVLAGIVKHARRSRGYSGADPAESFERSRVRPSASIEVYSPTEVEALVRAAESERDAALYRVAAYAGLRRSELRALRWRDVDFARESIFVRAGYTDQGGLNRPKSDKGRSVPMIPLVVAALDGLSRREHFVEPDDLVFCNRVGKFMDAHALYKHFRAAARKAGLRELRFHDLRHTFMTMAVQVWPLSDVKAYAGHSDIQTTMQYVHFVPKHDAAAKLGEMVERELGMTEEAPSEDSQTIR